MTSADMFLFLADKNYVSKDVELCIRLMMDDSRLEGVTEII